MTKLKLAGWRQQSTTTITNGLPWELPKIFLSEFSRELCGWSIGSYIPMNNSSGSNDFFIFELRKIRHFPCMHI